jgi:thiol-disulfide isomerase/thioredoxin
MKKIFLSLLVVISLFMITGCVRQSAKDFKEEYEAINGRTIRDDIKYRDLTIPEENPYIKVSSDDIAEKIKNKETFYLYVGDPLCPWCRSGLEKMIEVANKEGIKDIYYVDFWDDEHNEILRDLYSIEKVGDEVVITKTREPEEGYKVLYNAVYDFIQDYTVMLDGTEYTVGQGVKKVYGGDHFYFQDGVCMKYVSLRSDKLVKANDPLTEEVLKDQENMFTEFFAKKNVCTGDENC